MANCWYCFFGAKKPKNQKVKVAEKLYRPEQDEEDPREPTAELKIPEDVPSRRRDFAERGSDDTLSSIALTVPSTPSTIKPSIPP